jgi:ring-1,2-phenylacetyl-CoA epoxidase subunit PaaA
MRGTKEQKEMAQDAMNRWWWPSLMMFGPSDKESSNSADLMKWKVKLYTNDDLRQRFIDRTVEQAHAIGLQIPDDKLKWNEETRHYDFGEINWDEFFQVINGNGPCNKLRLKQRNDAHTNGQWVRDAAKAYAAKKKVN